MPGQRSTRELTPSLPWRASLVRRYFLLLLMCSLTAPGAPAAPDTSSANSALPAATSPGVTAKLLTAVLAREPAGEPADSFSTETPTIYLRWHGEALHAGDKIRCIWIAQDVGKAAPAGYQVDEACSEADGLHASGVFTLSKPKSGWPEGKYRVDIYVGPRIAETLAFTIEQLRGD